MNFFDSVVSGAAMGSLCVAFFALYWANRSAYAAEQSAEAAKDAASSAKRQADTADKAHEHSQELGRRQTRAYLSVAGAIAHAYANNSMLEFTVSLANSGQSPALDVSCQVSVTFTKPLLDGGDILFRRVQVAAWSDVSNGGVLSTQEIAVFPEQLMPAPFSTTPSFIQEQLDAGLSAVRVVAEFKVGYRDVFGIRQEIIAIYEHPGIAQREMGSPIPMYRANIVT